MLYEDGGESCAHVASHPAPLPIADCLSCDHNSTAKFLRQQLRAAGGSTQQTDVLGMWMMATLALISGLSNHATTVQHGVACGKSTHIPMRSRDIQPNPWYVASAMGRSGPTRIGREFGRRLRACRIAAGFENAADFAHELGIEGPTYRRYERGEAEPPFEVLISMSRLTGKTIDFLITGRKDQNEERDGEG